MRTRARWLPAVLALTSAVVTAGVVTAGLPAPHGVRREARPVAAPSETSASQARAVLRAWDRRRASAWERGDLAALSRLYAPGSATGRRDVAMLAAYRRRGLRVTGMTRQVLRLRVTAVSPRVLGLVVTDRLVDARVVGPGVGPRLGAAVPDGRAVTRRVGFVRVGHGWQVAEVRAGQPAR